MSNDKSPWKPRNGGQGPRVPVGLLLWVGLLLAVGIVIWLLAGLYPGRLSSRENILLDIVRLVAILAFVSSGLIFTRRINVGEAVRNISIWVGLAAILLVGYSYRTELTQVFYRVSGEVVPGQAIATGDDGLVVTVSADGHYYVNGRANGQRIRFMIDTGASGIVLSPQDAARIGIDPGELQFVQRFHTANGVGLGAPYRLDSIAIGSIELADAAVSVNQAEMDTSLLGMAFLERLNSFEFRDGKLYLRR